MTDRSDIIIAPATAPGGALSIIRLSGEGSIALCDGMFRGRRPLTEAPGHTLRYGRIVDGERTIDDVTVALFRAPHSYTGEEAVEITCHGSRYIVAEIMALGIRRGARTAEPGEFTIRAFLAGRIDLSQAEAVADLIASDSRAAHALASTQMRGGYSAELGGLRNRLLHLCSLLELELDFSEEDVEFADRTQLREAMTQIDAAIARLISSFSLGNALKEGVAVAIVGAPNVGKSTLLNRLLGEERAMVSEIAGTTRDVIEETVNIGGIPFRFLDTAGLRTTGDRLEQMGIERTCASMRRARIILLLSDATRPETDWSHLAARPGFATGSSLGNAGEHPQATAAITLPASATAASAGAADDPTTVAAAKPTSTLATNPATTPASNPTVAPAPNPEATSAGDHEAADCTVTAAGNLSTNTPNGSPLPLSTAADPIPPAADSAAIDLIANPEEAAVNPATTPAANIDTPQSATIQTDPEAVTLSAKTGEETESIPLRPDQAVIRVLNKIDCIGIPLPSSISADPETVTLSAKTGEGIEILRRRLCEKVDTQALYRGDTIVSNSRHLEALMLADEALHRALRGLDANLPSDLLSEEIRQVVYHLGTITGEITTDEILGQIFSKFCIGK